MITATVFEIVKEIKSKGLSPETTYGCYLVYKSTEDQPLLATSYYDERLGYRYLYLVSPPDTPIIGQKHDQKTHSPLKMSKLIEIPRQRSDGWMEVKVQQYQNRKYKEKFDIDITLENPNFDSLCGLIIQSIELKPIVAHSV